MSSLDATEPAKVVELARATQVSTEHATADVATLEVHDIFVRGERTRVRVEVPERAKVIVVLFADGIGVTRITESGKLQSGTENFLIRTRTYFLRRGFTTVVFDGPTDHPRDLRFRFRRTAAHEMDIGAVIAHLRGRFGLPVCLVGTSRGTTSVVSGASQLDVHRPDGIVLTSSMLAPVTNGNHVFDFSLEKISIPALITHHREDGCVATLARDVPRLARELSSAAPKGVKFYEGGTLGDNECGARSHHGYQGIEEQVVDDIAAWIPRHYEASISSRQSRQLVQPPLCSSRISSLLKRRWVKVSSVPSPLGRKYSSTRVSISA